MAIGPVQGSSRATDGNGTDQTGNQPRREQSVRLGANAAQFDIEAAEPETQRGCSQWCRRFWQAVRNFFTRCGRHSSAAAETEDAMEEGLTVEALLRIEELEKKLKEEIEKDKEKGKQVRLDNAYWLAGEYVKIEEAYIQEQSKLEIQLGKAEAALAKAKSVSEKQKCEEKVKRIRFKMRENRALREERKKDVAHGAKMKEEECRELEASWLRSSDKQELRKLIIWEKHNRRRFKVDDIGKPELPNKEEIARLKAFFPDLRAFPKYMYIDSWVEDPTTQTQSQQAAGTSGAISKSSTK